MTKKKNPTSKIGTLNEYAIHNQLKEEYTGKNDKTEQEIDGYYIDIIKKTGLVEIQTKNFSMIKPKLKKLLAKYKVKLVHNIPEVKWLVRIDENGEIISKRKSPKKGRLVDLFNELVSLPEIITDKNFSLEILMIEEEELRCDDGKGSWRRRGVSIKDRKLIEVIDRKIFHDKSDFLGFLPCNLGELFTNENLAKNTGLSIYMARKITYCLRKMGAIMKSGKKGKKLLFMRARTL